MPCSAYFKKERSIPSVSIYSEVDAGNPHVWLADESVCIGEPRAYLDIEKVMAAIKETGATAVHPGYGFLAENAKFVEACDAAGHRFYRSLSEGDECFCR